jgi:putative transferase (TIGR04331 family)
MVKKFIRALPHTILSLNFIVRLPSEDYGWGVEEQLKEYGVKKFHKGRDFYQQFMLARLIVCDHLHTTWLEALGNNRPLIAYYHPEIYCFRKSAMPYIDLLKQVNILFDSPIDAADHLQNVYPDIDSWWNSQEVQEARREFVYRYARTSEKWADEWVKEFRRVLNETT